MRKFYLTTLIALFAFFSASKAQTLPCSAAFQYVYTGLTVSFYPAVIGDSINTNHHWQFGDGTGATVPAPAHAYLTGGVYTVKHKIVRFNSAGAIICQDSATMVITLQNIAPCNMQANFTLTHVPNTWNVVICQNTSVNAAATDTVRWTFGDSTPAMYGQTVTHQYANPGTYNICIRISRAVPLGTAPCVRELCQTVVISNTSTLCNMQASFTVTHVPNTWNVVVGQNTSVNAAATDTVRWNFGDGTPAMYGQTVTHQYANPGTYNVCIRISRAVPPGAAPCVRELCQTVVISNTTPLCNLQASFVNHRDSLDWRKYYFNNTTPYFLPSDSIRWTFGDGTSATGIVNPVHVYANAGTYNVCLRVKRNVSAAPAPCVSEICYTVVVTAPTANNCTLQAASFNHYRSTTNWHAVYFVNTTGNILPTDSVRWTFGDGTPAALTMNATHTYSQAGTYNVCLRVKRVIPGSTVACVREYCKWIVVDSTSNTPTACTYYVDFASMLDSANHSLVHFNNLAYQFAGANATWNFGDGTTGAGWNTQHLYNAPGVYNVCLRIQYPNGCVREKCKVIQVPSPAGTTCTLQPYPNPVQNQVSLSLSLAQPQIIYSRIFNASNVIVRQQQQNGVAGFNTITFFNIGNLPAGIYRIVLNYGSHECHGTFVKY